ncbi:glycosyltransferase [Moorena producens]|uniref:glycosyltransferase n=1 Tax=Moorena producens TaxID=1155739 RepID=UPI003C78DB55
MKASLISIIIPVYNDEKTIKQTIESVLNQTFSNFELIVIDDGSQDSTWQIISSIKDARLKIFSYPNAGVNRARNRGFSHASGDYIAFLDADDLWHPDKLEFQLNALQANPQAAVAYSWTNYIDESGQFLRRGNHITLNGNVYPQLLLTDFLENGSNVLICRKAFDTVGQFDESLTQAEDWHMWLRLAAHYPFVAVPYPHILYRVSANSASSDTSKMEAGCLQVIERAFAAAPDSLQYLKKHSLANLYKYLIFKALESSSQRHQTLAALRFIGHAIRYDPSLLLTRTTLKVFLKVILLLILPAPQSTALLNRFPRLSNTSTILGYLRTKP